MDSDGDDDPTQSLPRPGTGGGVSEQQRSLHNDGYREGAALGHAAGLQVRKRESTHPPTHPTQLTPTYSHEQQGFDVGFVHGMKEGEAIGAVLGAAR